MTRGRCQTPIEAKRETLAHTLALPARDSASPSSFSHSSWRRVLATGVASAALFAYSGRPVRAAPPPGCTADLSGTIVVCTGDQSGGVALNNGGGTYTTLNVNNLITDIAPGALTTGVLFTSTGAVELNVDPGPFAIITTDANGIFASSNTSTVTINSTADISTSGSGATAIQGSGQNAAIVVTSSGNIATSGDNAFGIAAGTVYGPVTVISSGNIATSGTFSAGINVGSIGQLGTDDGAITIRSTGNITTTGTSAIGINAATVYGPIDITSSGNIAVSGSASVGINAQTQGAVTITTFGNVASGPDSSVGILGVSQSSDVLINTFGTVATAGNTAPGIDARAVGGTATVRAAGAIVTSGDDSPGIAASGFLGVTVVSTGDIRTYGDIAPSPYSTGAISAESQAGDVEIRSFGDIATDGVDAVGIYARAGATAMVFAYGNITTLGDGAAGIAASGYTGTAVLSTGNIRTFGADAPGITAYGPGDVAVGSTGNITTTGATSDGINVVSTNGMAAVVNSGDISATGFGSAGIYAAGYAGTLVMNTGNVVGGPCCAGVMQRSAGANILMNWGTISAGLADFAIDNIGESNTVENFGTVTGDVMLIETGGGNQFINHAGALFNTGADVIAGSVLNEGIIAPGARDVVQTTALDDNFTQTSTGTFAVDVDGVAATSDRINVADFADLAGKVAVTLTSLPATAAQSYLILRAFGGVTDNGLGLTASPALHATLSFPNGTDVVLGIAVDFTVDGLNPNQRAIATNLGEIFTAGVGGVGPVLLGLLNVGDLAEFKTALNQLSPEIYSDAEIAALYAGMSFSNSLLSCKVNGTDTASIVREGQCLWAGANARFLDSGTTFDQIGFNESAGLFTAGAQVALDDQWRLGFGAGYQSSSLQTATGAESEGALAQGGVALKYNPGPLLLAGVASAGGAHYDTRRPMSFGGFAGLAEGDQDLGIFSGGLRAAYVLGTPSLFFKPIVDANVTRLELGGVSESGGNGAALSVASGGHTVISLAPVVEAGTEWWLGNGTLVRPLIRAGAIWYDDADFGLTASFAGAPLGVSAFTINTGLDEVMGLVGAGVEVINGGDAVLRLSYDGQLGSQTQIHSVGIKGSAKF